MSYTRINGQPQGAATDFVNRIREALIAEIFAINGYAEHIANSHMKDINTIWQSILRDEKDHYGMFLKLLRKYDPGQYKQYLDHAHDKIVVSPLQPYQPDYDRQLILNNVRNDIKGELEAVILYEQQLEEMPHPDIKKVFTEVIFVEKGHLEHLTRLLLKYDPDKYNGLK